MDDTLLNSMVRDLVATSDRWACRPLSAKIDYLDRIRDGVLSIADDWVAAAVKAKGLDPDSPVVGEEWMSGPYALLSWIADMRRTLTALNEDQNPLHGFPIRQRPNGQSVVRVYPNGIREALLLHGSTADVWMQPGQTPADVSGEAARVYRHGPPDGRVALVLGAGNIASIAPLDVLYKLYAECQVVLLKLNPVNDYLGPFLEQAFACLVDDGYLRFAYGAADVGTALCQHPDVDTIHVTGSARTYDAIVYGPGPDGEERKSRDERTLDKPITSELGGVSPTIVVPGPWTEADFRFQAEHLVTQKLHNSGHNCVASQVLVLPAGWAGTPRLLAAINDVIEASDDRPAYYPGADERLQSALRMHANVALSATCALVAGLDSADASTPAFREEFFGPVWAITEIPGEDAETFLRAAVRFANETLEGTLGANIVIDPKTARQIGPTLDAAIAELEYGTVAVNTWTALGYLIARAPWGAFPGQTRQGIQSGIGVVHNALLLENTQKTVVRGPFRAFPRALRHGTFTLAPRPPWFVTNRTAHTTGRRLTSYAAHGRIRQLPGVFASALRG